ncbi:MAG: YdhR family protein [Burkholderiaceae bacterium]|nr:YdhR family protein [Burkholderiaceae bacterium]
MTAVLLHIRFPYEGPWSDAMSQAYASLADDIATEPGLRWKEALLSNVPKRPRKAAWRGLFIED